MLRILARSDRRRPARRDGFPAIVVPGGWRSGPRDGPRLTPHAYVPTMMGRATPSLWSPFLRVGARTLRTEQCAKSQCVYPVEHGRCGSPCLSARRSYGNCNTGRPIRVCCSGRPTFQQRTRTRPSWLVQRFFYGEFDPGSGRTLAACLTHASRAGTSGGVTLLRGERRTGE